MTQKGIVVVGSLNLDLVVHVNKIPAVGETVSGSDFQTHPGGKGANQAAEIGLLGHPVHMIGRVGSDDFGKRLRESLKGAGVDTTAVGESEAASGTAMIVVQVGGDNSIVVALGANGALSASDLDAHIDLIRNAAVVLTQLETPIPTLEHLSALCEQERVPLILDPAPAQLLPPGLLRRVSWITPNETEAQILTSGGVSPASRPAPQELVRSLMALGPRNVLLKRGERGAYIATEDGIRAAVPAYAVDAVDTTAAGDAFNGAFAVGLARGSSPQEAAQFASAAAAISVTRHGALPSMPTQAEVEAFLAKREKREG